MDVRQLAQQLAGQNWILVPLLEGRCYPKDSWWKDYAENRDITALLEEERFVEAGSNPGLAVYLDPAYGLIHIDIDLDIYKDKALYNQLEQTFPKLVQCPTYRTPSDHQNYLVRCSQLTRQAVLQYSYKARGKVHRKTAFELRPAGNLFPIAGYQIKGSKKVQYRPVRPITGTPDEIPEFTLDELKAIYDFVFNYLSRTRHSSRIISDHTPFFASTPKTTRSSRERKAAASCGKIESAADLAMAICTDLDILDSLFEEFDVRVAHPGKYVHCPFHGPDNHPSMTIYVADDGCVRIRDWHDGTDYDIVALHYALRTGEPGNIDRNTWWQEVTLIARKHHMIPSEEETRNLLAKAAQAVSNPSVWEGATPASVEAITKCFNVILEQAIAFGNLFSPLSARTLAEKAEIDLKAASRAANFLVMAGVLEKGPKKGRSDTYRVNPNANPEDIRRIVEILVEHGFKCLTKASQNVFGLAVDARKAYHTYTRQGDKWEAEGCCPSWRRPFMSKEEIKEYTFVDVELPEPKRKTQDKPQPKRPTPYITKHLIGKLAGEILTKYPEVLPTLPFTLDWKECSNGWYRIVGPDTNCFRLWVDKHGQLDWAWDTRPHLGALDRIDLPPLPEECVNAIKQRMLEETRRLKFPHAA